MAPDKLAEPCSVVVGFIDSIVFVGIPVVKQLTIIAIVAIIIDSINIH